MKANTSKERSFYTQGQQFAARVLLAVWLLASGSPEGTLATPKRQPTMVPATTTSPGDPSLANTPPTPPPGGILQLPPDAPGSFWGNSVASSPSIERVLQQRISQEPLPFIERDLLRTSPKVSPASENLPFQARGGERVRFACQMGQWRAEVSSHIGAFSRRAILPVVCSQGTDVVSSLEVLSNYPSWQRQRQIHVVDRNVCPMLGEVVYLGALGLKGGGQGQSSTRGKSGDPTPFGIQILTAASTSQQELDPPLVTELRALASASQIDQKSDKLAGLGAVLLELAKSKQAAGASAEDLSPYTEAAILYQHVLSISAHKNARKKKILANKKAKALADSAYQGLAQIEISMLGQATGAEAGAITPSKALPTRISEDKQRLETVRTKAREEVERLAEFRDKQGRAEEVLGAEAVYIEGSKKLFTDIAKEIQSLLGDFYQEGEEELKAAGIACPCNYAIMGLGSIALQQTTPYSDLEFAILMEDAPDEDEDTAEEWRKYFRKLTHLVHFRVINLGETVLPFSEYKISLDHLGRKGLNFDLGGKTPLGRKDKDYELIQPVQGMMEYLKNKDNKMEQMDKLLPFVLERTCYIYGTQGLHNNYLAALDQFWSSCQDAAGKYAYQERMMKTLLKGMTELAYNSQTGVVKKGREQAGNLRLVGPKLHPDDAGRLYDVKQEIYRLPDRLLYGLAFYYGILPQSAWDAVDKLLASKKINEEAARHLKYMASFAVMLRLETYLHHGQQDEKLSLRGSLSPGGSEAASSQAIHALSLLPPAALKEDGSLFRYYYTALPLHQQMEEFFEMLNLRQEVRKNAVVDRLLGEFSIERKYAAPQEGAYFQSEPFYDTSCAVKVGVYNRLLQYKSAKDYAAKRHEEVKASHFYNTKKLARYSHNLAVACYNAGRFDESQDHFTRSLELLEGVYPKGHAEVSYMLKIQRNKGIYHYNRGEYDESRQCFDKSWQLLQAFYNDNHPETAQMLLSLGEVDEAMGNFQESLDYKEQSLEMLQSLYAAQPTKQALAWRSFRDVCRSLKQSLGSSSDPETVLEEAYEAWEQCLYERPHPEIARALLSLGDAYAALENFVSSLKHKEASLSIFRALYGRSHPQVARALLSLGDADAALENFASSEQHKKDSLEMLRDLYGSSHPEVARALLSLGEMYALNGKLVESEGLKKQSWKMLQAFYRRKDHPEVARALDSLNETRGRLIQGEGSSRQDTGHALRPVRTVYPQHLTLLPTPRHGKEPAGENTLLRDYYSKTNFPYVKSLIFDGQHSKHVKDLDCQLMLLEQKLVGQDKAEEGAAAPEDQVAQHHERLELVKTPIALQDLFKKRSIKPGEPEQEVQRILLIGDPGTGKTTVSKQLAYQWSVGAWGQEFHTLYLLPVRSLQQSEYDGRRYNRERTLATAIVNNCFFHDLPTKKTNYQRLREHIEQELKKSTTLVILDGLDERAGASKQILTQAQDQTARHKLLMLSRPYGIETERQTVELEIEHVGFNRAQLERYVGHEVSASEQASELLGYIDKHENIRSIAYIPVNLQILCALWQDKGYGIRQELAQGSLPGLYEKFSQWVWRRYKERNQNQKDVLVQDREALFDKLGQIALSALEKNQILIEPGLIDRSLTDRKTDAEEVKNKCEDAGFLLLQSIDQKFYQFPHLTFQEYFAGRALAQQFLSEGKGEQAALGKLVSKHKYKGSYGRTLTFMAGEVSRVKRASGIEQLLGLLEQEKEVVGLQHLRLQLRVLHEWLCIAGEDAADELAELERGSQVLASLEEWFVRAFAHVRLAGYRDPYLPGYRLLALLKSSLQTFGSITSHAPGLLELFKKTAQGPYGAVRLAAVDSLGGSMASVDDEARVMLQAMADDRNESREIQQAARKALREATGAEATQDEAAAGGGIAQGSLGGATGSASQSPEDLLAQLRQAAKDAKDEDDKALRSSRGSLVQAVAAASQEELRALLDLLLPAAQDWNGSVRAAALEALLKAPLDTLLKHYWSTPDARLIPYITPRLYHTPLVIAKSVRSAPQRVSLYAAAGQAREWRQPQGVLADFERYVQDAVSQLSQVESKLSARVDKSVWEQYFGAIGEEPALPDDLEKILDSPCPFWPGNKVKDTHLLALIPSRVGGKPLTLDYLGELIKSPKGEGHGTKYRFYWDGVRKAIGSQSPSSSYWVLMTKDVLPESREKRYQDQCALVARHQGYTVPGALESAVVMLLHHVRSGERLYSHNPDTYTRCREKDKNDDPVVVGGFSSVGFNVSYDSSDDHNGVAGLRKFRTASPSSLGDVVIDASVWARYFGAVDSSPSPPSGIDQILNSPCPFWEGKRVRETHLLVLIPKQVADKPLTLDYLGQLIQQPQGGGHATKYRFYWDSVREAIGSQTSGSSYWVLMTKDVLPESRDKSYMDQYALVAAHAERTGLAYEVPGALEAAVVMLLHHVRSGERLYSDDPETWTRCRDKDKNGNSVVVGGFSSGGLFVDSRNFVHYINGVAGLRKF